LRQFFHFLKLNGWIKTNIVTDFPYPKIEKTIPYFLTIEEYNSLLNFFYHRATDVSGYRNLVMIMMLGLLGLRLSSVISLNIEDVDIESGLLHVLEKGAKQRPLIMPKILCHILGRYLGSLNKRQGPLFLSKRNKRLSPRMLRDVFQKAASSLEIDKHLHAHLFRHTAATHLNKVSDPEITRHVLGHMRSNSTKKYTHLNPDQYAVYMQTHPYMGKNREVTP
jgi:integrase/recombinase XerC